MLVPSPATHYVWRGRTISTLVVRKVDFFLPLLSPYSTYVNNVIALLTRIQKECSLILVILGTGSCIETEGNCYDPFLLIGPWAILVPIGRRYLSRGCEFKLFILQFYQFSMGETKYSDSFYFLAWFIPQTYYNDYQIICIKTNRLNWL